MIYIKVNDTLYPASIAGRTNDKYWGGRESKAITLEATFATADALFTDGTAWVIVSEASIPVMDAEGKPILDENGERTYETKQTEYDNSEFCLRGDLTVHTDGTCTVKMGKLTELEAANAALDELVLAELGGAE